jgi:hypothetical protein
MGRRDLQSQVAFAGSIFANTSIERRPCEFASIVLGSIFVFFSDAGGGFISLVYEKGDMARDKEGHTLSKIEQSRSWNRLGFHPYQTEYLRRYQESVAGCCQKIPCY